MDRADFVSENVAKFMISIPEIEPPLTNSLLVETLADQMAVTLTQLIRTMSTIDTTEEQFLHMSNAAAVVLLERFGSIFSKCVAYTVTGEVSLFVDLETNEALDFVENLLKENDRGMAL